MKRFAQAINFRMFQLGCTTTDVAARTGVRRQYIQSLVHGLEVPSKKMVERLGEALRMDVTELATLAAADHMERKYGVIAVGAAQDIQFEVVHALWQRLTESQRNIILATMRNFVEQNTARGQAAD